MIINNIIMFKLMGEVREVGLGECRGDWRVDKYKVEDMLKFFYRAFWSDAVLSLWGFDKKLVDTVKENEEIIKNLLQSELEREYRNELNISLGNVEEIIEWIDIINNNQEKNSWIVWKQFWFTTSVISALISFLKLYQSANSRSENEYKREDEYRKEREIILILIVKALKYAIGSVQNGYIGVKSDIFSKFEEILHKVLNAASIETDERMQLIFQTKASSYGNAPKNNIWIEDFIRSVSDNWNVLVHFLKKTQVNKNELLLYLEKNIIEVVIEYGTNFIFILSNTRDWKKDSVLLFKTTENILQEENDREKIKDIILLFFQGWVPVEKIEDLRVVLRKNMLDRKIIAEDDFCKIIQSSYYGG